MYLVIRFDEATRRQFAVGYNGAIFADPADCPLMNEYDAKDTARLYGGAVCDEARVFGADDCCED